MYLAWKWVLVVVACFTVLVKESYSTGYVYPHNFIRGSYRMQPGVYPNADACFDLCLREPTCDSVDWHHHRHDCYFHPGSTNNGDCQYMEYVPGNPVTHQRKHPCSSTETACVNDFHLRSSASQGVASNCHHLKTIRPIGNVDDCKKAACENNANTINWGKYLNDNECNLKVCYGSDLKLEKHPGWDVYSRGRPSACNSNPCRNGGQCSGNYASYTCSCPAAYFGTNCETVRPNACNSNPCRNGGHCSGNYASYTCTCTAAFIGTNCETAKSVPAKSVPGLLVAGKMIGYNIDGGSAEGGTFSTLDACAQYCEKRSDCVAADFFVPHGQCFVHNVGTGCHEPKISPFHQNNIHYRTSKVGHMCRG